MIFKGQDNEYIQLQNVHSADCFQLTEELEKPLTFLWFGADGNPIEIDGIQHIFNKNQVVCLTEFHRVNIASICNARMLRFNRPFYCIVDHDIEVGCKGLLFFGASQLPVFTIQDNELEKFQTVWKMFEMEMNHKDEHQLEMLQTMLKRFLILSTRVFKAQNNYQRIDEKQTSIIREYNFLVEQHFRTKHTVADYAAMLNKSAKTLSNLFSKLADKTPLQFIQDRKMLEARRLLRYTDKSISEVAYEVGFEDIQSFSRFFRNIEGVSPSVFKEI